MTSLKSEVEYILKRFNVPGAIVSLKSNFYDSFLLSYGYSEVKSCTPINTNDKFRIGSNTKMFVGIVFLQLYQEGLIDLDKPLSDYLIGLPETYINLTVRNVGSMKSGIPDYLTDSRLINNFEKDHYRNWLPSELYAIGATGHQSFLPGEKFEYCNTNTIILGLIIERITGNSLQYEIKTRIMEPLNLQSTKFETNGKLSQPRMDGYHYINNKLKNVTCYNPSYAWSSGNMSSDLRDISKFIKYAIGKDILLDDNATKQQRIWSEWDNTPNYNLETFYGFHLGKIEKFIGHNGLLDGYSTFAMYEISTGTSLVIAVNLDVNKKLQAIATVVAEYIIARLYNNITFVDVEKLFSET